MSAVEQWIFDEAVLCDDGRYQVRGRLGIARTYHGELSDTGYGFDFNLMLVGPVDGYGLTPQAARDAAVYAAGCVDGRNSEVHHRTQCQIMGGYR
jgi:hypothetical protein